MTAPCLEITDLGKAFRRYKGEWRRVCSWLGLPMAPAAEHWVLRNISFSIAPGEAVGIIGQNGAGKSTLLKLVTGTLRPTEGGCTVNGRIAAILELGMGFNPEFTGRQNVFHAAGLMGFEAETIAAAMPRIEEFAEIGAYFDQPVRTYSSGMQVRVAFSVATAFRPDILIVDEALSVGDIYFQHKSFERIREFRNQGTTLLIVSHDKVAIQSLCSRAILLGSGGLLMDGEPEAVMDYYNALIAEREEHHEIEQKQLDDGRIQTISGSGEVVAEQIGLYNHHGDPVETINVGEPVELRVLARAHKNIPRLVFGYLIKDRLGQSVFGTNTYYTDQIIEDLPEGASVTIQAVFPMNLGPGSYSVTYAFSSSYTHLEDNYHWVDLALLFQVINLDKTEFIGTAWLDPAIQIQTGT